MLVTILSVAFNSGLTIARTIESVLNQTYDNIEYIIIDGKSSDNTVEIARAYQAAFDSRPGRSLTIISEPDRGMYDGLNKGAKMAHGELVGQINTDDWYEPDAVKWMVRLYRKTGYDVAWGSLNMRSWDKAGNEKKTWVKKAHIGHLWTTSGWCHPAMFSKRSVLLQFPYPLESMYDDFDYITAVHHAEKKIVTTQKVISNFSFIGGQSTKKSLKEVKSRVNITYGIYKKYGMSKFYWFYRVAYELAKYIAE
jgi:glycosyltransferase involved in cell wall biosynthesis